MNVKYIFFDCLSKTIVCRYAIQVLQYECPRWECHPAQSKKAYTRTVGKYALGRQVRIRRLRLYVDCVWNVMAHAQKPDFVFRAKRTSPFKSAGGGCQFSRLLAAEVCASAVVMLETTCSEVMWRVLATHNIRQFPLHFPSRASPCAITFQPDSSKHHGDTAYDSVLPQFIHSLRNLS